MYSAVVVFIHPGQTLIPITEAVSLLKDCHGDIIHEDCSCGWCALCKLSSYKMSRFFPVIPHMPFLALPAVSASMLPSVPPTLCLDMPGCQADDLYMWLLHTMWGQDKEFTIMPLVLQHHCLIPWELCKEEEPKLWQNVTYITWKAAAPGQEVGLVLTVVTTNHKEFENKRMVVDISNEALIKYRVSNLDEDKVEGNGEDGHGNLQDMIADNEGEDYSNDDENVDNDVWRTALEMANKTDDSGFRSSIEDGGMIEELSGIGTQWTAMPPRYQLGMSAGSSSFRGSHMAGLLCARDVTSGMSFDQ